MGSRCDFAPFGGRGRSEEVTSLRRFDVEMWIKAPTWQGSHRMHGNF